MSKKTHTADSFLTYALLLVAVALAITGIMSVQAVRYDVAVSTIHAPKESYRYLFNADEFRKRRRELNEARNRVQKPTTDTADESSTSSSSEESISSSSTVPGTATGVQPYTYEKLSYSEKRTLLLQLRMHVCPSPETNKQESTLAIGYRLLCESLLRKQKLEVRVGPKNSEQ